MRSGLAALCLILLCSISSAQDPGTPDTVFFCGVQSYVYGPPYTGHVKVEVCFYNDEYLIGLQVPLRWTGPVVFTSGSFNGAPAETVDVSVLEIYPNDSLIFVGAVNFNYIAPGTWALAGLLAVVQDTGRLILDTATSVQHSPGYLFFQTELQPFIPIFNKLEYKIVPDTLKPGDVNGSGNVDLADILSLAYYIFRQAPIDFLPVADVNADCRITLADIITIANYFFKAGWELKPGCAWN